MSVLSSHDREKLSYQYTLALDTGDMDTVARILSRAETDPDLEQMILDINHALVTDDLQIDPEQPQKETNTMPVFRPTKRKRSSRTRWTAVAAIVASILFSGFALFFATEAPTQDYSAESIVATPFIDKPDIVRQYLDAWNNNDPALLEGLLTEDYRHSELSQDEMPEVVLHERITELNSHFKEVHFFISDFSFNETQLYATLTLKGLHRNVAGQEINYTTTGYINVRFVADKIAETQFTMNLNHFIERYGQFEPEVMPTTQDLFQLPPDNFDDTPQAQTVTLDDSGVKGMSLNINAGHAELRIGSLPDVILNADISNVGAFDYDEKGDRIKLINIVNHPYYLLDETGEVPVWFFKIGDEVRTDLDLTLGNSDAMLDLAQVDLQGLTLTLGGGTTSLNLPDTGANYHVTVTALSSLARLQLDYPDSIGLKIDAHDGVWQSRNYNHAESVVNIQLNGSLSMLDMLGS